MLRGSSTVSIWVVVFLRTVMAQSSQPPLSFEVATIKPASPPPRMAMAMSVNGGPGTSDPGQITYTNAPLKRLLEDAYTLPDHQVLGPAWLDSRRFDLIAKVPPGTTKEQARIMLQNILGERFGMALHHEQRMLPVYALVIAKSGSKLRATSETTPTPIPDGFPKLPPGREGVTAMGMGTAGTYRLSARRQSVADLADLLSRMLNCPITDATGLSGTYDFVLEFVPERVRRADGTPLPTQTDPTVPEAGAPDAQTGLSMFAALQQQLGLKLDPRKAAGDVLVIDRIEKIPAEN
jgi:uncharacterized protein (TIGR03435 family)